MKAAAEPEKPRASTRATAGLRRQPEGRAPPRQGLAPPSHQADPGRKTGDALEARRSLGQGAARCRRPRLPARSPAIPGARARRRGRRHGEGGNHRRGRRRGTLKFNPPLSEPTLSPPGRGQSIDSGHSFSLRAHRSLPSQPGTAAAGYSHPHGVITDATLPCRWHRGHRQGRQRRSISHPCAQMVLATPITCIPAGKRWWRKPADCNRFMGWAGPLLTDSGGYQVFSLGALIASKRPRALSSRSPRDGARITLTPERSMEIQMAPGGRCGDGPLTSALLWGQRKAKWPWPAAHQELAERCRVRPQPCRQPCSIVRRSSIPQLRTNPPGRGGPWDLPGIAIGGSASDETGGEMHRIVRQVTPFARRAQKPR